MESSNPFALQEHYFERLLSIRDHGGTEAEIDSAYIDLLGEIDIYIQCAAAEGNEASVAAYRSAKEYVESMVG